MMYMVTTSSTSSTTSILGALGGGSGVDMVKLASDLAQAQFAGRQALIDSKNAKLDLKISAASNLRSMITNLASAIGDRVRAGDLATTPSVANSAVASVSLASGAQASGSYSLEVAHLARGQNIVSKAYGSANAAVGEGKLTLRFGTIAGTGFTEDTAHTPLEIDVTATDTLSSVAAAINAKNAGVTAYVANGSSGAQLLLKGADGANNGYVIETSGASVSGGVPAAGNIDYLNWHPATDVGELRQGAHDAVIKLDTVEITSATNDVTGLPGGLSLKLKGTNSGAPTTISFSDPTSNIASMMGDFVSALNTLVTELQKAADPVNGELGGDAGARRLKRELSQLSSVVIMPNAAAGEPKTFSELGLSVNRDGTFTFDAARLNKTIAANADGTAKMFTTGLYGVYGTMDKLARAMSFKSDPGSLGGSLARYEKSKAKNTDMLSEIADQLDRVKARMVKQFSAADSRVSASQSTLSFLQNQIDAWNNSNG